MIQQNEHKEIHKINKQKHFVIYNLSQHNIKQA